MKKNLMFPVLLALGLTASALGQTYQNNYHKVFDIQARAEARALIRTNDQGYLGAGWYLDPNGWRPWLQKLDANFQPQWARTWATADTSIQINIQPNDVFQTGDTGYIVCGRYVEAEARTGAFLMKLDPFGLLQWFRVYPTLDDLYSVIEMPGPNVGDVLYMACGTMRPFGTQRQAAAILTADIGGNPVWLAHVSGPKDDLWATTSYRQIIRYDTDVAALVGWGNVDFDDGNLANQYDSDVLVSLVNTNGAFLMNELYGKATEVNQTNGETYTVMEAGTSLDRDPQTGDLLITGSVRTNCISACMPGIYADLLLFRVNVAAGGTVSWAKRYDILGPLETNDRFEGGARLVWQPAAQQLFVTGTATTGFLTGGTALSNDMMLLTTTGTGAVTSWELFGDAGNDRGAALVLPNINTVGTSAAMLGTSNSFNTLHDEWYFVERFVNRLDDCHDLRVPFEVTPIELPLNDPEVIYAMDEPFRVVLYDQEPEILQRVICQKTKIFTWGDLNCDDFVDFFDIDPFLLALMEPDSYTTAYPNCDASHGDVNHDGTFDFFDVDPFIDCVLHGGCP